ncbi:MAG: hypothetical protein E6K72_10960 [Candidatus Eisenbacteria bacterium]|uniref:Uncharacterized protein n=1 Tax=Eiseniibacteriota bacterium TaxID=2212470 RepID=A0A538SI00_UNCEI|nr:MAG: hypothetical protein E6K72_10960 [Candidatus Eisenbacteria bacterium]
MKRWAAVLVAAIQVTPIGGLAAPLTSPPGRWTVTACVPDTVGLDSSIWNTGRGTFFGRALGQTFLAFDTVITRITVWRTPNNINAVGTHLFVTTVDAAQQPPRPMTQGILQDGPTVFIRDSDPPGQLVRMDFIIEPPLALPRPGLYAFFLQREGCDIGETRLTASTDNPYPYGIYWITGRTAGGPCALRSVGGGEDYTDLIFEIEFCRTDATPVRGRTWGELKLLYR